MAVSQRGMTLVEVVVAAAIVLLVVVAASSTVAAVAAAGARSGGRDAAVAAAAREIAVLRGLPFAASDPATATVVARVFPNADPAAATPTARFASDQCAGCPAGTFFTVRQTTAGPLTVAATFVVGTSCGWTPVDTARLDGFDARTAAVLPAGALLLRVSVAWRAGAGVGVVTRTTVVADRPDGLCRLTAPAVAP